MTDELMAKISSLDDNSKSKFRNIMSSLMSNALDETLLDSIDNFTDKEYEVFIRMLAEATEGQFSTFEEYSLVDYEEIPVSIEEFIINPEYIGRSTDNGKALYPYWKDLAVDIFKSGSKVQELALTGAIGTGKSTIALICLSYVLYKLLCLREPAKYYQLLEGSKIAIALFNISVNQVYGIGYDKLQSLLKKSPWFLRHGTLVGRSASRVMAMIASGEQVPDELLSDLTYHPGKDIHIVAGSQESNFTGYDVFAGFLDEMNFYNRGGKASDPSKFMETGVMKVYTAVRRRIESRFMMLGKVPGLLILVSSTKNETDPLEVYIKKSKNNPTIRVVDEPQWIIKNTPGRYSGKYFKLLVGDKYRRTQIIGPDEDYESYINQGRRILDVPIEHYDAFRLDADKALTDIAGVSLVSGNKFIDANKYRDCILSTKHNAFSQDIVEMGMRNGVRLENFFDISKFSYKDKRRPTYVHWDASKTGDRTGLGIVASESEYVEIDRIVDGEIVKVKDRMYDLVGSIGIQAPPGDEIPFRRIYEFILYLRANGFRILGVTMDSYQSVAILQDLTTEGFNAKTVSLDRKPDGYQVFRSCIYESRIRLYESVILETEVTELEQNAVTSKVDHPADGCLVGETILQTNRGPVRMMDLLPDDKLYSYDECTNDIVESDYCNLRITKEVEELYDIELVSGQVLTCTGNHPILTTRGYVKAEDLTEYDEVIVGKIPKISVELYRGSFDKLKVIDDIIKELYVDNKLSVRDLERSIGLGKTTILNYLRYSGYLRDKSSATKEAFKKYPDNLVSTSNIEDELCKYLSDNHVSYIHQYYVDSIDRHADFYIEGTIIEINGIRFHEDFEKENDRLELLRKEGYDVIILSDSLCYSYGSYLYDLIINKDPELLVRSHESYTEYFSRLNDYIKDIITNKYDRRTYRYGIPSYTGSRLSDHWKYDKVDIDEFKKFLGNNRDKTIQDVYSKFGSRNKLRRIVREYLDISFEEFQARYCRYTKSLSWKVQKLIILYINKGIISKRVDDPLTIGEFKSAKSHTIDKLCKELKVSRNYLIRWICEIYGDEYYDSHFKS